RRVPVAGDRAQSHSEPPAHAVRHPHHRVPRRGARGAEPPVAEYPQLFQGLALRVLNVRGKRRKRMRKCLTAFIATLVAMVGVLGPVAPTTAQSKGEIVIGL